jgi:hypothetical protein
MDVTFTLVTNGVASMSHTEPMNNSLKAISYQHSSNWGSIMWGGKGQLIVYEYSGGKGGVMNSKRYQNQVLDGVLKKFYMKMKEKRGNIYFQQDNTSSYTSNLMLVISSFYFSHYHKFSKNTAISHSNTN